MIKTNYILVNWVLMISLASFFQGCQPSVSEAQEGISNDIKWTRYSVEYEAICIQTYRSAWKSVKDMSARLEHDWAVVLDVDETVLDNSPYEEMIFKRGEKYPAFWADWVRQADAEAIPGAKAFLDSVRTLGVHANVVFITNRDTAFEKATMENLKLLNIWDDDVILCRQDKSDTKEVRRHEVKTGTGRCEGKGEREIIALIGDQLHDVVSFPQGISVDSLQNHFRNFGGWGKTAFMLPNPMYGSWMNGYE